MHPLKKLRKKLDKFEEILDEVCEIQEDLSEVLEDDEAWEEVGSLNDLALKNYDLEKKLDIAVSALKFYADLNNWICDNEDELNFKQICREDYNYTFNKTKPRYGGKAAREALEAIQNV